MKKKKTNETMFEKNILHLKFFFFTLRTHVLFIAAFLQADAKRINDTRIDENKSIRAENAL